MKDSPISPWFRLIWPKEICQEIDRLHCEGHLNPEAFYTLKRSAIVSWSLFCMFFLFFAFNGKLVEFCVFGTFYLSLIIFELKRIMVKNFYPYLKGQVIKVKDEGYTYYGPGKYVINYWGGEGRNYKCVLTTLRYFNRMTVNQMVDVFIDKNGDGRHVMPDQKKMKEIYCLDNSLIN